MKSLIKRIFLLIGCYLGHPSGAVFADQQSDFSKMRVTVIAIGTDQSFDSSTLALRYAESTAKRFATVAGGKESNTTAHLLLAPTFAEVTELFAPPSKATSSEDVLILYVAALSDDEGIHVKDRKMPHSHLADLIDRFPAKQKFVIMDRMMVGATQPGKYAFRNDTYHRRDRYDSSIAYLVVDTDQLPAYENHSIRSLAVSDIVIHGLKGRADRNHDGIVVWGELLAFTEATLKFSPHLKAASRQFLDHCEEDSPGQLNLVREAQVAQPSNLQPLQEEPKSDVEDNSRTTTWLRHFDPTMGMSQHRGFRGSESVGMNLLLGLTVYERQSFGGNWGVNMEMQKHSHVVKTDEATGTIDYLGLSGKARGRYIFKWETQDLRPHIGIGQVVASQKLQSSKNLGVVRSQAFAPLMQFGIASHFFRPGGLLHGGLFFRREMMFGKYEGERQDFKSTGMGLEIGYGGFNQ